MQNKGAIRLFAILLALVSLYQLSFTWVAGNVRKEASEHANEDRVKEAEYLDSISGQTVYNFLWLQPYSYKECQDRELNLGLDLKGGMNVILEISVVDLIKSLANNSSDPTFVKAIELAKEKQKNSQEDFVSLFGQAFSEIDPGARLASIFSTRELKDRINFESTNEEVLQVIQKEADDAIENSYNIMGSRIDKFGVAQPNIQRLETKGRILVELPGIDEPERVRKLLQGTAKLEFWETYDNSEIFSYLSDANKRIREIEEAENKIDEPETPEEKQTSENLPDEQTADAKESKPDSLKKEDTGLDSLMTEIEKDTTKTENKTLADWEKENPFFAVLRPNTNQQGQLMKGAAVGFAHFKDTSKVNKYLQDPRITSLFPRDLRFYWTVKPFDQQESLYQLVAIKVTNRDGKAALEGDVITNARDEFSNQGGSAKVSMNMNSEGAKTWARLTRDNIGKQIAVVLDGYVYSYPVVNSEISGGSSEISGNFDLKEAKDLANILKSGKMPAPARIIQEEIVGPSLGQEAINSGLTSFLIAFGLVLLYMVFYYRSAGLVADVALILNIFFIFGVLASFGAVLTLPGIAGIILTVGISVDANVLIYERIREEMKQGKGIKLAISDGYKNAYSAIIDANVTSLLTAIILGVFGKGPIFGFAVTLGIGILTSLFSAIFITRLIFERFLDKNKAITFSSKSTENLFKNMNIDFLSKRKLYYTISSVVIVVGIISLIFRGLNFGVDFKGGRSYVVRFDENVRTVDVQEALKEVYGEAPEVKIFGDKNQVKITTKYRIEEQGAEVDNEVEAMLFKGLKPFFKEGTDMTAFTEHHRMSSIKVGPTIADDIKVAAVWAVLFSLFGIFLYIFFRFKDWRYGLGAVGALAHDTLFVLGLFSLLYGIVPFSLEIDQAFIAAILTVIGYSINDTVVVFDRIREYRSSFRKKDRETTLNTALNSTLSRTVSTSLSTLVVLLAIFIFGGEVIRGFIFAMLIGVLVGTYSSLFIATPIVYDTEKAIDKQQEKLKAVREKRQMKKKKTI